MAMEAEEGIRPRVRCATPRTRRGQSEGKIPLGDMSPWFVGAQFEEGKGTGEAVWNLPSSSLLPLLFPIKEFQERE